MTQPSRNWRDMPSAAFGAAARDWIAVLPLAAIEQHGPHLPVGVDALIAEGMIDAACAALDPAAPVTFLPVQQVMKSNEHARFPGTLTLDWRLATDMLIQIGASVAAAGPRNLILITSHGGNIAPMEIAARELRAAHGMRCLTTSWGRLIADGPASDPLDIHAGRWETSVMLALRPELVDRDAAADFASDQARHAGRALGWHGAAANMGWLAGDLNPAGAVGDAGAASAAEGARIIAAAADGFSRLIADLRREMQAKGPLE